MKPSQDEILTTGICSGLATGITTYAITRDPQLSAMATGGGLMLGSLARYGIGEIGELIKLMQVKVGSFLDKHLKQQSKDIEK